MTEEQIERLIVALERIADAHMPMVTYNPVAGHTCQRCWTFVPEGQLHTCWIANGRQLST